MSSSNLGLTVERTVRILAPREHVFELLTDVRQMTRWIPVVTFEPQIGGRFEMVVDGEWVAEGEVFEYSPPASIGFTWDWRNQPLGAPTQVRFDLEEDGAATVVRLRHTGFPELAQQDSHTRGWTHYTLRLKTAAEGRDPGPDLFRHRSR